jgi:hypothetical protein
VNWPPASITCPRCGRTSHNPNDVREGYCGNCHDWTGAIASMVEPGRTFDRGMYFDRQGHEISLARWAWLNSRERFADYRRIAEDHVDLYWISTIWLGLDHSFGSGPPLIFETMVFLSGTPEDMGMQRYATEDQARAGHEAIVAEIRVLDEQAADRERINDE